MTHKTTLALAASIAVAGFGLSRSASAQSYHDRGAVGLQLSIGTGGYYGDQNYYGRQSYSSSRGYYDGYDEPRASWRAHEQWERHERAEAQQRYWELQRQRSAAWYGGYRDRDEEDDDE